MQMVKELTPLCRTRSTLGKALLARVWMRAGGYRGARQVEWWRVSRLVFVCKGNICRSPYAEHVVRKAGFHAVSFGLHALSGESVNPIAVDVAGTRGVDLSGTRTRGKESIHLTGSDLLVAMEPWHFREVGPLCRLYGAQKTLLGLWGGVEMPWLPDPYSSSRETFEHCYAVIDRAVSALLEHLPATARDAA